MGRADVAALQYLLFERAEAGDGVTTLHALAATSAERHPAVLAEAQQVLDWAWQAFAHGHGPADEGGDWWHDLQAGPTADGWHELSLTLTASDAFVAAFDEAWGQSEG